MKLRLNARRNRRISFRHSFESKRYNPLYTAELQNCGKINAFEVEEIIFCLLDSLINAGDETKSAVTNSLLEFAKIQPEFTIKSILSFLEVQETTISHQCSLLSAMRECISQCQPTLSTMLIREILLFMLKELSFINPSDLRHVEMIKTVSIITVLCPDFSVDIVLAFVKDMRIHGTGSTDAMRTYIQILTRLCTQVPRSFYMRFAVILSQIIPLYDSKILTPKNSDLCKDLVRLFYALSNVIMLFDGYDGISNGYESDASYTSGITFEALNLEDTTCRRFAEYFERYKQFRELRLQPTEKQNVQHNLSTSDVAKRETKTDKSNYRISRFNPTPHFDGEGCASNSETSSRTLKGFEVFCPSRSCTSECVRIVSPFPTNGHENAKKIRHDMKREAAISLSDGTRQARNMNGGGNSYSDNDFGAIFELLFPLMIDNFLPEIYTNLSYNVTCMEVLYSLSVFSPYISESLLKRVSITLLDAIIVRVYNYLPNLHHKHLNTDVHHGNWIALYKSSSATFSSRIATIFTSIGYTVDRAAMLPPTYFVRSLRVLMQVILIKTPHTIIPHLSNICEVLFGLLVAILDNDKECFLLCLEKMDCFFGQIENKNMETLDIDGDRSFLDSGNIQECLGFVQQIILACRLLMSNTATSLFFSEFIFRKLKSKAERDVVVVLFILGCLYEVSSTLSTLTEYKEKYAHCMGFTSNCSKIWRLLFELDSLLSAFTLESSSFSMRLLFSLTSNLSKGQWLTFHCLTGYFDAYMVQGKPNGVDDFLIRITKPVFSLIGFVTNFKIAYDIEERISQNSKLTSGKKCTELNQHFFRRLYQGVVNPADKTVLAAANDCFVSYLLTESGEALLIYLIHLLPKNSKRSVLTVFRFLHKLVTWDTHGLIPMIFSIETLSRVLAFVLVYIHDPLNYFGEAYFASRLLPFLLEIIFKAKVPIFDGETFKNKVYKGLDSYLIQSESDMACYNISGTEYIVDHFEKVARIIFSLTDSPNLTKSLPALLEQLKTISQDHKQMNTFQTGYNTFIKTVDISPSSLLTLYHSMGILNIIASFASLSVTLICDLIDLLLGIPKTNSTKATDHCEKFGDNPGINVLLNNVSEWTHLMVLNEEMIYTMTNLKNLKISYSPSIIHKMMHDPRLFFCSQSADYLQEEITCLRGTILSTLGMDPKNYENVLLKAYYALLSNIPRATTSFTIFGRSASALISGKIRSVSVIAIAHLYNKAPSSFIEEFNAFSRGNKTEAVASTEVSTEDVLEEMGTAIKCHLDSLINITDGNKFSELYTCVFQKSSDEIINKDMGQNNRILKCVISPILYLLNNENDPSIQLCLIRSLLSILGNKILSRNLSTIALEDNNIKYLMLSIKRLFYFMSNPSLKEFGAKLIYDEIAMIEKQYLENFSKYQGVTSLDNNNWIESTLMAPLHLIQGHGETEFSNISFGSLIAICFMSKFHPDEIRSSLYPYSALHIILSFGDCYYDAVISTRICANIPMTLEIYESFDLGNLITYYMLNALGEFDWNRLAKILLVTLFMSNKFTESFIRHRILVALLFLRCVMHEKIVPQALPQEQHVGWVDVMLLLWAHLLRLENDNGLKSHLFDCIIRIINIGDSSEILHLNTHQNKVLENYKISSVEWIDRLIPKAYLMTCLICCINFLGSSNCCLSDSFAKILHKIIQYRYDELDSKRFESILETIFKRFANYFQSNNVPTFLRLFIIDLAKVDFDVLCTTILVKLHNYGRKFQLSVVKLIISDLYLLVLVLEFLEPKLLQLNKLDENASNKLSIDFILDFTLEIFLENTSSQILLTTQGVRFMTSLIIHGNYLAIVKCDSGDLALLRRFEVILETTLNILRPFQHEHPENIVCNGTTMKDKINKGINVETKSNTVLGSKIMDFSRELLTINHIFKMCFMYHIKTMLDQFQAINTRILMATLELFCNLLKEGHFIHYNMFIFDIIGKITSKGATQKYFFKALYYYIKSCIKTPFRIFTHYKKFTGICDSTKPNFELNLELLDLVRYRDKFIKKILALIIGTFKQDLKQDVLYYIQKTVIGLVHYSTRYKIKTPKNFDIVVYGLLKEHHCGLRNSKGMFYVHFQLYIAMSKLLKFKLKTESLFPLEIKRLFLKPIGLAMLFANVDSSPLSIISTRLIRLACKFLQDFGDDAHEKLDVDCVEFMELILMKMVPSYKKNAKYCFCGCDNPVLQHAKDHRLCLSIGFFLLDLFSSCFPKECWKLDVYAQKYIDEELEKIKKNELHKRSHDVLFGGTEFDSANIVNGEIPLLPLSPKSKTMALKHEDFYDIDELYNLCWNSSDKPDDDLPSAEDKGDLEYRASIEKSDIKPCAKAKNIYGLPCPPCLLKILEIADYHVEEDGQLKRTNFFKIEGKMLPFSNAVCPVSARNATFADISNLGYISNTTMLISPTVYRFMLLNKYLKRPRMCLYLSDSSLVFDERSKTPRGNHGHSCNDYVTDDTLKTAIKLSVALIRTALIRLSTEVEVLGAYIRDNWPSCFLEVVRYNAILHFEALAAATTKQLCKLLEVKNGPVKFSLLESIAYFASIKSSDQ